jgi:hypothetical protein
VEVCQFLVASNADVNAKNKEYDSTHIHAFKNADVIWDSF